MLTVVPHMEVNCSIIKMGGGGKWGTSSRHQVKGGCKNSSCHAANPVAATGNMSTDSVLCAPFQGTELPSYTSGGGLLA